MAVVLVYSCLYVAFFAAVIFSGKLLGPGDGINYYIPNFYAAKALWEPLLFGGFPFAAEPQSMTWYPLAFLSWMVANSWNVFVVSAYVLASCFAYAYVFSLTESRLAGYVGGLVYGMSGFMVAHLAHTGIIHAALWMPLSILALEKLRCQASMRWFAVCSFSFAGSALAGHLQIFGYSLGLALAYALFVGGSASSGRWKYWLLCVMSMALGLSLAAVQLLPTAQLAGLAVRSQMSLKDFSSYSLPPSMVVLLIFPYLFGGAPLKPYWMTYFGPWNLSELSCYVGLLPIMLSFVGFISYRKKPQAWFWCITTVLAMLLAISNATSIAELMYHIPVYNKFRCHSRHLAEMALAISVLSGLGVAAIQKQMASKRLVAFAMAFGVGLMGIAVAIIYMNASQLKLEALTKAARVLSFSPFSNLAIGIPLLMLLLASAVILLWVGRGDSKLLQSLVVGVVICDLASFGWFYDWRQSAPAKRHLEPPPVALKYGDLLRPNHQRILPSAGFSTLINSIPPNLSRLWYIASASGYVDLLPSRIAKFFPTDSVGVVKDVRAYTISHSLDMMGVRYVLAPNEENVPPFLSLQTKHGYRWAEGFSVKLGRGPSPHDISFFEVQLIKPVLANGIAMVHSLEYSSSLPDQVKVLRILATDVLDGVHEVYLQAGRDSAEWAFDCDDVAPQMQHARAKIFEDFPATRASGPCTGHRYWSISNWEGAVPIKKLGWQWVGPEGALEIFKVSLANEHTGESYPITYNRVLGDSSHWRHVEAVKEATIYENLRALPRAWLVHKTLAMNPEEVLQAVRSSRLPDGGSFDPRTVALVEQPLNFTVDSPDAASTSEVIHLTNSSLEVKTISKSPAFLVLGDVYYPGWKVTIDGNPGHLLQTNYVLRGVIVPEGEHTVAFVFQPRSFYAGLTISLLSLAVLIGGMVYERFRVMAHRKAAKSVKSQ